MATERQTKLSPLRGQSRRAWRGSWLLASTALSAVLAHPLPARAQNISSTATPQGGVVVGGNASIAQSTGSTTITQSSNRAAINWQSYNVGSNAQVTYVQPSASAVTLNRVITADPSVIAGHITANGQIVLINQSGVVFTKGAEVTAQSVIVSTSNISNSDFMAGKMNFTGTPNPGAKIVNDGKITAGEAGLVGLVAPQVANNGIITARLGQVVLAGADAFTLDLYGDKLVSLDVTKAVREVDLNGKTVPALVTNKGLILADGGKITLTAADADALVSQLLQVGGTLRANSTDGQTGTISLQAVGGGINIAGNLLAQGTLAGNTGGKVEALATGTVAVASSAVINASGQAGGGTIALGTNLARATAGASDSTAPRAAAVSIASGAQIKADATAKGNGGKVTLLSSQNTAFQGTISTTGGTLGGNGGDVEISSDGVISLGGTVIDTAIDGQAGEILLDPQTLIVASGSTPSAGTATSGHGPSTTTTFGTDNSTISYVDPLDLLLLHGTVILDATKLLSVASAINNLLANTLELTSGQDLTISASIDVSGALDISAAGTLDVEAPLTGSTITLADTGTSSVIEINSLISGTELILDAGGTATEGTLGGISVTSLTGSLGGGGVLNSTLNTISTLAGFTAGGAFDLLNQTPLLQTGTFTGTDITLASDRLTLNGHITSSGTLDLSSTAGVTEASTALLDAPFLTSGSGVTGDALLTSALNSISTLAGFIASGTLSVADKIALAQTGSVAGSDVTLSAAGLTLGGDVSATNALDLTSSGTLSQSGTLSGADARLSGTSLALGGTVDATSLNLNASNGAISQASTGALAASTLSGSASGAILLGGTGNSIGSISGLSAGQNILLASATTANISGLVSAGSNVTLQGAGFTESGSGAIDATTLTGSLTGGLGLGGANSFGTLGALNAGGDVTLDDAKALILAGLVSTTGTLALTSTGAVSEAAGGTLNVGGLSGSVGGALSLANANNIGTLGALNATGNLLIDNSGTMTLGGAVSAGSSLALVTAGLLEGTGGSLAAGTIALAPYGNGGIDLGGTSLAGLQLSQSLVSALDSTAIVILGSAGGAEASTILAEGAVSFANALAMLDSSGGIGQSGTLAGTTLGLNGTSIALNGEVNATALTAASSGALSQSGSITSTDVTLSGTGLTLDGLVNATTLSLASSGTITQNGLGTLDVSTLAGTGGNILLNGSANSIASLNGLSASGTINLQDTAALTVQGAVSAGSSLAISTPTLTLASTLTSPLVSLAADNITDNGGAIHAGAGTVSITPRTATRAVDLGGTATGLDLSGTLLGAITASTLNIATQGSIVADGSASVATQLLSLSGDGITFAGTLSAPGALALASTGGVTSTSANHLSAAILRAGGAIGGNVDLSQGSNSVATLGSFTLGNGSFSLADAQALAVAGPISASGAVVLGSNGTIHQTGAISGQSVSLSGTSLTLGAGVTTGILTLTVSNGVSETGGGLSLTALTGSVTGNAMLNGATNHIGTLANFTDNGTLLLGDALALTQAGYLTAGNATLAANGLAFTGNVTTPGTLALESTGNVSQSGGNVNTGVLTSTGTVQGNIIMTQAGNLFPNVQNLAATGVIDLTGSSVLGQTGTLSASAVTLTAPSLALNGTLSTSGVLQLTGGSASEGSGAVIDAALLTTGAGGISGNAVLNNGANSIASLGNFTAGGGMALADGAALAVNGPVSVGGTLALWDASNITQTGGTISATALTSDGGTIGGNAVFGQSGNVIPVLGPFAATGNVQLNTSGALSLSGNVLSGGTLSLYSGGAISQGSGVVTATRLNASGSTIDLTGTEIGLLGNVAASGDVNIANAGGLAGTLTAQNATLGSSGGFTSSGTARIANGLTLTATRAVNQTGGAISAATATITAPSITLSGATDVRNELALRASGDIAHDAGSLDAGTLTGTAGQLADFTGASEIGTLGSFLMPGGTFLLNDAEALTLLGPLVANVASITATGALYLDGSNNGGLFLSGSTASSSATKPRTGVDSVLAVTGSNPSIVQTGTFYIDSGPNLAEYLGNASPLATLFMSLANSGTVALAAAPGILEAPNTDVVLASGGAGKVTGNVNVLHLEVLSAASVDMTGSIANITGPTAAGNGSAFPFPQPGYRFNTCPIGSVNCTILPIAGLPQANPLESFDLSPRKRKKLDKNVLQPGVAARDF